MMSVINKLKQSNLTISFAESCTGGKLASSLVTHEGISDIFLGGVVAYSKKSKIDILKIDEKIINKFGLVSKEIAKHMAISAKKMYKSDICISSTGNIGLTTADKLSSVGKVFIAINFKNEIHVKELDLTQSRVQNIDFILNEVFTFLDKFL